MNKYQWLLLGISIGSSFVAAKSLAEPVQKLPPVPLYESLPEQNVEQINIKVQKEDEAGFDRIARENSQGFFERMPDDESDSEEFFSEDLENLDDAQAFATNELRNRQPVVKHLMGKLSVEQFVPYYEDVKIQVLDDRSTKEQLIPVMGVQLELVGTEIIKTTEADGIVSLSVPGESHFWVRVSDRDNLFTPSLVELSSLREKQNIFVTRRTTLDYYREELQLSNAYSASLCGKIGAFLEEEKDISQYQLVLSHEDGRRLDAFYFNQDFFLNPKDNMTSRNGRFCFFTDIEGAYSLHVFYKGQEIYVLPVFLALDTQTHISIEPKEKAPLTTTLLSVNREDALYETKLNENDFHLVEASDLYPLFTDNIFTKEEDSLMTASDFLPEVQDQLYYEARSADYAKVLYAAETYKVPVTFLIPDSFIENLSYATQVTQNPDMGSLFVELFPENPGRFKISVFDAQGKDAGQGFFFAEGEDVVRSFFFNLPSGKYSVAITDQDNNWVGNKMVFVQPGYTSYQSFGRILP